MFASPLPLCRPSPVAPAAAGLLLAVAAAAALTATGPAAAPSGGPAGPAVTAAAPPALRALYVANAGQAPAGVRFAAHGAGGEVLFRPREVVLAGRGIRMRFAGADPRAALVGTGRRPGVVNVLRGERARWRTHLPTYAGVAYRDLYPGVDLRFAAGGATWTLAAGADPDRIAWRHPGATAVRARPGDGALEVTRPGRGASARTHTEPAPVAWQRIDGRRVGVAAAYRVDGEGRVGFALGRHDRHAPLSIGTAAAPAARQAAQSPLGFSTFLGGSQWDEAMDVETDAAGATYVAGFTGSLNIRTARPVRRAHRGIMDAYVAKIAPDGRTLQYATFLGGRDLDVANALAVDRQGNAYVAGRTGSEDFPTRRARQSALRGSACQAAPRRDEGVPCHDAFVAKLSRSGGALVYSTYLGGTNNEEAIGLAVDRSRRAYVVGNTDSEDFPTRRALQRRFGSRDCASSVPCANDAFVAKLSASGRSLVFSSYLGGAKADTAGGVAVDRAGAAYLTGATRSADFPTRRARQPALSRRACGPPPNVACPDVFVAKLRPDGRSLAYSTYLGGRKTESSGGIAVDRSGNAYVTGSTQSADFPTVRPLQAAIGNGSCSVTGPPKEQCGDAFVTKLSPDGQRLRYSTFLGGNAEDAGLGIAVDATGAAHVAGSTDSRAFRTRAPLQPAIGGGIDAYVAELGPAGALRSSTFLGGTEAERANAIAVDARGRAHVAGRTLSANFPTAGPLQGGLGGDYDQFVTVVR
ncbi:MAG: hypothetical protein QOC64_2952 [Solirubrobacteraceae bacterium]|nr:hypothetical protein [Solirubrobacteraceae bacterium]